MSDLGCVPDQHQNLDIPVPIAHLHRQDSSVPGNHRTENLVLGLCPDYLPACLDRLPAWLAAIEEPPIDEAPMRRSRRRRQGFALPGVPEAFFLYEIAIFLRRKTLVSEPKLGLPSAINRAYDLHTPGPTNT